MNVPLPIYLDNNSTTQPDPEVVTVMRHALELQFGNPSSAIHRHGQSAKEIIHKATSQIAKLAGCDEDEIVFTSGATESINTVLQGMSRTVPANKLRIITCVTEHSAVLDTCDYLDSLGASTTRLRVQSDGSLSIPGLTEALISHKPHLVTLMHANNEIGTVHPVDEIAALCKEHGVLFHVDAAQTFGKLPLNFHQLNADFLSISGHKCYGPKGVGCLLIRRRNPPLRLTPLIHGGGQQRGLRSGTLNVPGIAGIGQAAEICQRNMTSETARINNLTQLLLKHIIADLPGIILNGPAINNRLPGNLNISIPNIDGLQLLPRLKSHLSVSSGSACTSGSTTPSYVLKAIGRTDQEAVSSIRVGIGRFNTADQIETAAQAIIEAARSLALA